MADSIMRTSDPVVELASRLPMLWNRLHTLGGPAEEMEKSDARRTECAVTTTRAEIEAIERHICAVSSKTIDGAIIHLLVAANAVALTQGQAPELQAVYRALRSALKVIGDLATVDMTVFFGAWANDATDPFPEVVIDAPETTEPAVVSKAQFAEICGVTPARISQLIGEGRIHGPAIVGEGRYANIVTAIALSQIGRSPRHSLPLSETEGNGHQEEQRSA